MEQEYESLRQEICAWQNRRFTTLAASITIVSGVLGLAAAQEGTFSAYWPVVTALLWFFLGSATSLIWYAGRANAKIAAYLIVFHERNAGGWESRLTQLKTSGLDWFSLNRMVFLIYVSLGLLSFVIPWSVRDGQEVLNWYTILLLTTGIWFGFNLVLLTWGYPREKYIDRWITVEQELHNQ